jgi:hypothetical protein
MRASPHVFGFGLGDPVLRFLVSLGLFLNCCLEHCHDTMDANHFALMVDSVVLHAAYCSFHAILTHTIAHNPTYFSRLQGLRGTKRDVI